MKCTQVFMDPGAVDFGGATLLSGSLSGLSGDVAVCIAVIQLQSILPTPVRVLVSLRSSAGGQPVSTIVSVNPSEFVSVSLTNVVGINDGTASGIVDALCYEGEGFVRALDISPGPPNPPAGQLVSYLTIFGGFDRP